MMRTWLRFNLVGLAGIFVQLAGLKLFRDTLGFHYLIATALAVELAVLHNFWWHRRWTWAERATPLARFVPFQCTTGIVSIAGNLFGMRLLLGALCLPLLGANVLSIAVMHVFNYFIADRYVFRLR